jgi:hypothetical protein
MSQDHQQTNNEEEPVIAVSAEEVLAAAARLRKQVTDPATTGSVHEIHGDNFTGTQTSTK